MKWNHLPMAGGLYDQNPGMLDRFYFIFAERAKEEERKQAERDRKSGGKYNVKNAGRSGVSRAGSRL